jgi:hypothetical protein
MRSGIKPKAALIAVAAGALFTLLIYYFSTALLPGTSVPVYVADGSTMRSNVSILDTPTSAEVDFLIRVSHSTPKFRLAAGCGALLVVVILWRHRERNKPWTKIQP